MALESGTRLGPRQMTEPMRTSGAGDVYKATDTRLNRTVALKLLPGDWSGSAEIMWMAAKNWAIWAVRLEP